MGHKLNIDTILLGY